jgi:predicted  nucleic acid-binding Zn-ribbon protein
MTAVEDDIQLLIQIVKKDVDIQERRKFLETAPARIKEIDFKIKRIDEELHEVQEAVERMNKERRHLEGEIDSQNSKLERKRAESKDVNSNEAFRALNKEIDYLEKMIYKEEERVLEILEQGEKKKKELSAVTEKVNSEKGALAGEKAKLEREMAEYETQLKVIEDEKLRIMPHLSERIRTLYKRILNVKGDSGVANLAADICQGCYSRMPPQKAHEVRKNSQIITCEVCGRILVYYPHD